MTENKYVTLKHAIIEILLSIKNIIKNIKRKILHGTIHGWEYEKKIAFEMPGVKDAYYKYINNIKMTKNEQVILVREYSHFIIGFNYNKLDDLLKK